MFYKIKMKEEEKIQIMVCNWVKTNTDLPFIHIANERKCNPTRGKILKQMGVMPGVFDIFIPRGFDKLIYGCLNPPFNGTKTHSFHGLWIELKSEKGKPSKSQLEFQEIIIKEKYKAEIAYGFNEAIEIIKECYGV